MAFEGHNCCWLIYGNGMVNKMMKFVVFLVDLAKWQTQPMQLGCVLFIIINWHHHVSSVYSAPGQIADGSNFLFGIYIGILTKLIHVK